MGGGGGGLGRFEPKLRQSSVTSHSAALVESRLPKTWKHSFIGTVGNKMCMCGEAISHSCIFAIVLDLSIDCQQRVCRSLMSPDSFKLVLYLLYSFCFSVPFGSFAYLVILFLFFFCLCFFVLFFVVFTFCILFLVVIFLLFIFYFCHFVFCLVSCIFFVSPFCILI